MRIIIDTNIFISREGDEIVQEELQDLLKIISEQNHELLVHPISIQDLLRNTSNQRKQLQLSKLGSYPKLESPPDPKGDRKFASIFGDIEKIDNPHDIVDLHLIFAIYRNAADFLISEDFGLHRNAKRIGISTRVLNIADALDFFTKLKSPKQVRLYSPPALMDVPMHNVDLSDPFFDSLKGDYPEFVNWWESKSREGRRAWMYKRRGGKIGAILIYKVEDNKILKICTLKVTYVGYKIGELLIKQSINFAVECNIDKLYLTHFIKEEDRLIPLIEEFGFELTEKNERGEEIYTKKLIPSNSSPTPIDLIKRYYPSFYDGENVKKFIVPIQPQFHNRLFTNYQRRQPSLSEFMGELIVEGNTIKKAYMCHSKIRSISKGDILLFYRSQDKKMLTSIAVVNKIHDNIADPEIIKKIVGKRTVYSSDEIEKMALKPTKVIIFWLVFHFPNELHLRILMDNNLIFGAPQSIQEVKHEQYLGIRELSGINEKFCHDTLKIE